jgi:hypothetical protein
MILSNVTSIAGRKVITSINASSAPLPSSNPIEPTIGFDEVSHRINPTLERMDADTAIENSFSSIVFLLPGTFI